MGRSYNDHAYIAAGWVNSIIESYNPIRDEGYRYHITPSQYWLRGSRAAVSGKSIYSFGNAENGKMIIPLDPREGQWYNLNNDIDVVGGFEEDMLLNVNVNVLTRALDGKCSLKLIMAGNGHWALLVCGKMYVFWGYNNGFVSTIEYYDFHEEKWAMDDLIESAPCQARTAFNN
uniref:Uncharacterized protein n=1 Tax=Glossina austeni TaxID=7395 RepID=A0A1A9V054_GLOAU